MNSITVLQRDAMKLLMPFLDDRETPQRKLIRHIGVRVEKLEEFGVRLQAPLLE